MNLALPSASCDTRVSAKFPAGHRTRYLPSVRRWMFVVGCWMFAAGAAPAASLDLADATIADLNAAFKKGTLTSEKLTSLYLARIEAYDKKGPTLNTVITLNPKALEQARALDAERKAGKIRGPLHGIPIVLKDNFDTFDLPTTAGSQLLAGSIPPDDAFVVKKLRDAGAVILAKLNLSEWAGGGGSTEGAPPDIVKAGFIPNGFSSMGGQTRNPHDLTRGPAGSSGGTGAAIAAVFAQFGLGTDTGGSIRGPSAANGIVGLKPTHGLLSRDGIVPLVLSFDTGGPMARNVYDIAVSLNVMTGIDPADAATAKSEGKIEKDYTAFLKKGSLKGARIGIARDFTGQDAETDRIFNEAVATLKKQGATIVDPLALPDFLLRLRDTLSKEIRAAEFPAQLADYLKTTGPKYPKTIYDVARLSNDPATGYRSPGKAVGIKWAAEHVVGLDDPVYLSAKNEGLAAVRAAAMAVFKKHNLDAIVYPTALRPATPIGATSTGIGGGGPSRLANHTGFPDLIVPAGMTKDGLPVTLSFFGPAFSEGKLLGYGFDFEQATKAIVLPKTTPALPADTIEL
jgi:amidase